MIAHGMALLMILGLAACSQPDRKADSQAATPRLADSPATSGGQSLAGESLAGEPSPVDEQIGAAAMQPIEDAGAGGPGLDAGLPPLDDDAGLPPPPPLPGPGDAGLPM